MWQKQFVRVLFVLLSLVHSPAFAGSQQIASERKFSFEDAAVFAKRVENFAAKQRARVFILARLGSAKENLPEGIDFTHVGLAVYSTIQTNQGETLRGYAIHNLYQDPKDLSLSNLVLDYPVDFFLGAVELKAGIIIPSQNMQQKILTGLEAGLSEKLHNPHYSIIANPYTKQYQNCTEHILDLLFAAVYSTDSIVQIKVNQKAYFQSHTLDVSPFKRFLAPIFSSDIQMSDQGNQIKVATFTSISTFMRNYGLADTVAIID